MISAYSPLGMAGFASDLDMRFRRRRSAAGGIGMHPSKYTASNQDRHARAVVGADQRLLSQLFVPRHVCVVVGLCIGVRKRSQRRFLSRSNCRSMLRG
jgi:hypothetical protein